MSLINSSLEVIYCSNLTFNYSIIRLIRFVSPFTDSSRNVFFISSRFKSLCRCRKFFLEVWFMQPNTAWDRRGRLLYLDLELLWDDRCAIRIGSKMLGLLSHQHLSWGAFPAQLCLVHARSLGHLGLLASLKAAFLFLYFLKIFFYKNIFSVSHFTVLYPYRPVGGRQGAYHPAGGAAETYM